MALAPTRLTTMFSRIGPDPARLTDALVAADLRNGSISPDLLERLIRETIVRAELEPPRPGPTWADQVSAALQHAGALNRTGSRYATTTGPGSRLPRLAIIIVCGWWAFAGTLAGGMLLASSNPGSLVPDWLGWLILLFSTASGVATYGVLRRKAWAPRSLYLVGAFGVVLAIGMGFAVAGAVPLEKILTSGILGGLMLLVLSFSCARYVRREALTAG
jgi:hypothetical protein